MRKQESVKRTWSKINLVQILNSHFLLMEKIIIGALIKHIDAQYMV